MRKTTYLLLTRKASLFKIVIGVVLIVISTLTIVAFSLYSHSIIIHSWGTVNLPIDVGLYWDNECTNPISFIDWGSIQPGSAKNMAIFVRNEGSQAISLNITAENWQPMEVTSYMVFSSNYNGQTIDIHETLQLILTLATSESLEGIQSFSFDLNLAILV